VKRRRVLYVDHANFMGGAEQSLLLLLKNLDRETFEPLLASTPTSPLAQAAAEIGVQVVPVPMDRLRGVTNLLTVAGRLLQGVRTLASAIRQEDVDIVHTNVMRASIYAALAARLTRRPLVWHVRDIHHEGLYVRLMSRLADRIIVISRAVASPLPSWSAVKTTLVYNGLDLAEFDPQCTDGRPFRREIGVPDHALLVGQVAWLAPWKGQHLFVEAAAQVAEAHPEVRFVIIGGLADERYTAYGEQLRQQAYAALGDRLIFAGPHSPIAPVMAGLDLLVHTAQDEPFGRVLVEAMALHVPVVALAGGGVEEIVEDGPTGLLVSDRDPAALAQSILALLEDKARREAMGRQGRRRVERHFNAAFLTRQVETVYRSLIEGDV